MSGLERLVQLVVLVGQSSPLEGLGRNAHAGRKARSLAVHAIDNVGIVTVARVLSGRIDLWLMSLLIVDIGHDGRARRSAKEEDGMLVNTRHNNGRWCSRLPFPREHSSATYIANQFIAPIRAALAHPLYVALGQAAREFKVLGGALATLPRAHHKDPCGPGVANLQSHARISSYLESPRWEAVP